MIYVREWILLILCCPIRQCLSTFLICGNIHFGSSLNKVNQSMSDGKAPLVWFAVRIGNVIPDIVS